VASLIKGLTAMLAPWVREEMKGVDLKDKRLNERLTAVLSQLGGHPTASIPAACGGYAETAAAYRLFDNDKVGFDNVLAPHVAATRRRMAEQSLVLLTQDTTEIDLTRPDQQVAGAGRLDDGSRLGAFLHPLMGFTPDGTPLGTVCAKVWTRDEPPPEKSQRGHRKKHTPIEHKESYRWLETFQRSREEARLAPNTQFVCLADSEADIYEVLEEAQAEPREIDWIIRACQDRALGSDAENSGENRPVADPEANHLREQLLAGPVWFTNTIKVRGRKAKLGDCDNHGRRQPRESRTAEVDVRAARVTLRAPWRHDRKLSDVSVNVVLVREKDPPSEDTPVEWILLTSLPIDDIEQVRTVIQYYCARWMIEVFFRTLKSGCRVEERRFEHIDRLLPCLAVYLIVTWRTLYVCRLGREFPEINCEAVFEPSEWKSVYYVVHREPPPAEAPTLQAMIRMVAQLGGYINRSRADEPGPQTVWLGLQRTHDIAHCWQLFGPNAKQGRILV
jgi:hypothetical protein